MKKYDTINSSVQEDLIAIREVKAFVRSDHERKNSTRLIMRIWLLPFMRKNFSLQQCR